ncbi:class I SAM-dependent methyltransferase [Xanthobacter sp. KR7-225]|uniref:class I SAM-dependent methyltransferase n=1 Tax=Xanthobacter sp. KR7-225 TaxID=3156613 RepID=UPI0032B45A9F
MSSRPSATIQDLVARQFGPQANAYVTSAVHAQGEDLEALARLLEGRAGARLIDLGCGGGHVSFTAAPHVSEVVACDLSAEMLAAVAAEAKRRGLANIATAQGVAERLPFADASFDIVVSRYSAHHWADAAAGVREARRMLKPGGLAVFMDVIAPENALLDTFLQTIEMLRDPSHVRDYAAREWRAFAKEAGFAVAQETPRRLRLEYGPWITRIGTSAVNAAAIRSLQEGASAEVWRHFEIEADGTFTFDTLTLVLKAV